MRIRTALGLLICCCAASAPAPPPRRRARTQAADLAGIYFAVQDSYEQQVVDANQQALSAAVRQYKAAYTKGLGKLPALLRTASATPELLQRPGRPGGPGRAGGPSPAHS